MILPRIIIADEYRSGHIPIGVLAVAALKEAGYKIRPFVGCVDETMLRLLELITGERAVMIDPVLCGSRPALRRLFQVAARPDHLNIVLTKLGSRWTKDAALEIEEDCRTLAEWLDCSIVPTICADAPSMFTVHAVKTVFEELGEFGGRGRIDALLIRAVVKQREFELAEQEIGRSISTLLLGVVPERHECIEPIITDLCRTSTLDDTLSPILRTASELRREAHVNWPMFAALAHSAPEWEDAPALVSPMRGASRTNIAVIRDMALSLGGANTELMLRELGVNLFDVPLEGEGDAAIAFNGVYVPHGLGYMVLTKFFSNIYVKTLISRSALGSMFMLAEGGSSVILGQKVVLPRGMGGEGRGFASMPFVSVCESPILGAPRRVLVSEPRDVNPLIRNDEERIWGYASESLSTTLAPDGAYCLGAARRNGLASRSFGVARGRALAVRMRLEMWSAPALLRRWLEE